MFLTCLQLPFPYGIDLTEGCKRNTEISKVYNQKWRPALRGPMGHLAAVDGVFICVG